MDRFGLTVNEKVIFSFTDGEKLTPVEKIIRHLVRWAVTKHINGHLTDERGWCRFDLGPGNDAISHSIHVQGKR